MTRRSVSSPASWEFSQRMLILVASQLVLALTVWYVGDGRRPWYSPEFTTIQGWLGASLTILGVVIRLLGTATLSSRIMSSKSPESVRLCREGLFAVSRNPLYLGSLLMLAGYGVYFGWIAAAGFTLLHWLRYQRVIQLEETQLEEQWGQEFEDYRHSVPRWFGRLSRLRNIDWPSVTADSLLANAIFVGFAVGCVAGSITGQHAWLILFQALGGAVSVFHLIGTAAIRRRKCREASPEQHAVPQ
jgi:protein-S-isoprenylcysteine O-methyltransferase Ste14